MDRLIPTAIGTTVMVCILKYITISISPEGEYQLNRALSMLGVGGMIVLFVILFVVYALTRDIVERCYIHRVHRMLDEGVSPELVISAVKSHHLSILMRSRSMQAIRYGRSVLMHYYIIKTNVPLYRPNIRGC